MASGAMGTTLPHFIAEPYIEIRALHSQWVPQ